jgi:hypothetical protein
VTPEEMRAILADHLGPITARLDRIESKVDTTNGRTTRLEAENIRRDAEAVALARHAKEAAALVASKAAETLQARERSRKWWLAVMTAAAGGVGAVTTLSSLIAQHIH